MFFQYLHQIFYILDIILVGNQERILGVDNDQVLYSESAHQFMFCMDIIVGTVQADNITGLNIAIAILGHQVEQGRPTAQIIPLRIHRHNHSVVGFFHYRVIN